MGWPGGSVELRPPRDSRHMYYEIRLQAACLKWGGFRWWFLYAIHFPSSENCPLDCVDDVFKYGIGLTLPESPGARGRNHKL